MHCVIDSMKYILTEISIPRETIARILGPFVSRGISPLTLIQQCQLFTWHYIVILLCVERIISCPCFWFVSDLILMLIYKPIYLPSNAYHGCRQRNINILVPIHSKYQNLWKIADNYEKIAVLIAINERPMKECSISVIYLIILIISVKFKAKMCFDCIWNGNRDFSAYTFFGAYFSRRFRNREP